MSSLVSRTFFFFNDTATTEIYTLSLHDALPIRSPKACCIQIIQAPTGTMAHATKIPSAGSVRPRFPERTAENTFNRTTQRATPSNGALLSFVRYVADVVRPRQTASRGLSTSARHQRIKQTKTTPKRSGDKLSFSIP